jgi:hypothetical protein
MKVGGLFTDMICTVKFKEVTSDLLAALENSVFCSITDVLPCTKGLTLKASTPSEEMVGGVWDEKYAAS